MNESTAEWLRSLHPLALQYAILSDKSPFGGLLKSAAEQAKEHRRLPAADNPFSKLQEEISRYTVTALDTWRDMHDAFAESLFLTVYGSPQLQAAVGIDRTSTRPHRTAGKSRLHRMFVEKRVAELKAKMAEGGLHEAVIRAVLYIGMSRQSVDERGFEMIRRIRAAVEESVRLPLDVFKTVVRDQYFLLVIDTEAAVEAIPSLLPPDREERDRALAVIKKVCGARGEIVREELSRLDRVTRLFGREQAGSPAAPAPATTPRIQPAAPPNPPPPAALKLSGAARKTPAASVGAKTADDASRGGRTTRNRTEPR